MGWNAKLLHVGVCGSPRSPPHLRYYEIPTPIIRKSYQECDKSEVVGPYTRSLAT